MSDDLISMLRHLDIDAALAANPYRPPGGIKDNGARAYSREVALAGMHRARLQLSAFSAEEKDISRRWLKENGWRVPLARTIDDEVK